MARQGNLNEVVAVLAEITFDTEVSPDAVRPSAILDECISNHPAKTLFRRVTFLSTEHSGRVLLRGTKRSTTRAGRRPHKSR
jgi:hypothetical protein